MNNLPVKEAAAYMELPNSMSEKPANSSFIHGEELQGCPEDTSLITSIESCSRRNIPNVPRVRSFPGE